ncbi:ABC transporter substrate-binding protein [Alphaproteobacteria bacterium]|nr:ABC transporter substrate-binding protein [Alphaproteobacteria bacterium]
MRCITVTIVLILKINLLFALNIEEQKIYGLKNNSSDLNIISSTDINIFDKIMNDFSKINPDLSVKYTVASTKDIFETINTGTDEYDVVMSSAMDLQIKLSNDGLTHTFESTNTKLIPEWASWKNEIYGFAIEPVVMVISKDFFSKNSLTVPINRRDFLSLLKSRESLFKNKLITYDINTSGAGYLFATQDARESDIFWRLTEIMGNLNTELTCCTGQMLDLLDNGEMAVAYNVLGSYANSRMNDNDLIKIIYPEDYTNLLLRTLLIPNNSKNKDNAENFVDFLLSENNQVTLEDKSGLPSIFSKDIIENYNSKPIRLDTGLLVFLDNLKRKQFLSEWNSAISQ